MTITYLGELPTLPCNDNLTTSDPNGAHYYGEIPMATTTATFEEVDQHIQKADLGVFQAGGARHVAAGSPPAAALPNVCAIYKIVRPILILISNLPLIPQKWRDALKIFVQILDTICP
jgi:hypothetical protein